MIPGPYEGLLMACPMFTYLLALTGIVLFTITAWVALSHWEKKRRGK